LKGVERAPHVGDHWRSVIWCCVTRLRFRICSLRWVSKGKCQFLRICVPEDFVQEKIIATSLGLFQFSRSILPCQPSNEYGCIYKLINGLSEVTSFRVLSDLWSLGESLSLLIWVMQTPLACQRGSSADFSPSLTDRAWSGESFIAVIRRRGRKSPRRQPVR